MPKKEFEPYIECRCISRAFVEDVTKIFDNYIQLKIENQGFDKATAEQINTIEESIKYFPEDKQDIMRNNVLFAIQHPSENKTLQFIKRYLENCECPEGVNINYRDGFHSYKNIKNMLDNIMKR